MRRLGGFEPSSTPLSCHDKRGGLTADTLTTSPGLLPASTTGIQSVMGWYAGYVEELQNFPKPMDAEQVTTVTAAVCVCCVSMCVFGRSVGRSRREGGAGCMV